MKPISSTFKTALEQEQIRPFYLLHMSIDGEDFRFTDCDVPLHVNGNLYAPRGFKAGNLRQSTGRIVDSLEIKIDNTDRYLTTAFVDGTPRGSEVEYMLVLLDDSYTLIEPYDSSGPGDAFVLFQGDIDSWQLTETDVEIVISNEFSRWAQKTLAKQSASCRWKEFKGRECGYTGGESWCDRTYSRCSDLDNTANFGGERWLPSIVDKEIWWGRKPK